MPTSTVLHKQLTDLTLEMLLILIYFLLVLINYDISENL